MSDPAKADDGEETRKRSNGQHTNDHDNDAPDAGGQDEANARNRGNGQDANDGLDQRRADDDEEIQRLARMSELEYDRAKKDAAKRLGASVSTLNKLVKDAKREAAAAASAAAAAASGVSSKWTITIRPSDTPRIVDEIEAAMIAAKLQIYQRSGRIVRPAKIELPTYDEKTFKGHAIEIMAPHAVMEYAERAADFEKYDGRARAYVLCDVRMEDIHALMARTNELTLPILSSLASCPSISADGAILDVQGYDPNTGVLYDPLGVNFPRVPDAPTETEIKNAFDRVNLIFHTMDADFETPADKGVAISTVMTAVARRGLDFAPMHGMDAPAQGSGKSMVHIIAAVLLTGNFPVVIATGKTEEEFEKRLGTAHMRGDPIIVIDNVAQPLNGEYLAQSITQPQFSPRILGKSEMPPIANRHFTLPNGNNLRAKGDIPRRICICRIDTKCAAPERRTFNFNPVAHAFANRAQLVVDILTLLKAYHNAGKPKSIGLLGFEKWSRTVRSAVIWLAKKFPEANLADPWITNDRIRQKDPETENLTSIMTAWHAHFGDGRVTIADVAAAADAKRPEMERAIGAEMVTNERGETVNESKTIIVHNYVNPTFREAILEVAGQGGKINNKSLGVWLSSFEGRRIVRDDGKQLTLTRPTHLGKPAMRDGSALWQVTVVQP